ncbi:MAG: tyrosine-type recombinase/integrase [Ruminococcus sp.]|nr:tyrosine-type recombinase/integrase [Ruminococcus sp.]MCM1381406.1 tyrosine-type recombinase/integrase [Muribaculaceae bacterium]MCM1479299.1 tyrosine-type recombinase/integrase [Muribaculaceae bacterium]
MKNKGSEKLKYIKARKNKDGTITSYQIRIFQGMDSDGKQKMITKTYKVDPNLTYEQNIAKVKELANEFKAQCDSRSSQDSRTFKQYAEAFIEQKQIEGLKFSTIAGYRRALIRINRGIGHIPIADLTSAHITALFNQLRKEGIRGHNEKAVCKVELKQILAKNNVTKEYLARAANVSLAVISSCYKKKPIMPDKAKAIAAVFDAAPSEIFYFITDNKPLSSKTIREHQMLVVEILEDACQNDKILKNPAKHVKLNRVTKSAPTFYQPDEVKEIMAALKKEPLDKRVLVTLMISTGMRRGEIAGLTWSSIDWKNSVINVDKTVLHKTGIGTYVSSPKTTSSVRKILLPKGTVKLLKKYREEWLKQKESYGNSWNEAVYLPDEKSIQFAEQGQKPKNNSYTSDFLFYSTKNNKIGYPLNPDTITGWCSDFGKKYDLPPINPHAFRHTAISILSFNNIDDATTAKIAGHSNTYITKDTYTHSFSEAEIQAAEALENVLFDDDDEDNE